MLVINSLSKVTRRVLLHSYSGSCCRFGVKFHRRLRPIVSDPQALFGLPQLRSVVLSGRRDKIYRHMLYSEHARRQKYSWLPADFIRW